MAKKKKKNAEQLLLELLSLDGCHLLTSESSDHTITLIARKTKRGLGYLWGLDGSSSFFNRVGQTVPRRQRRFWPWQFSTCSPLPAPPSRSPRLPWTGGPGLGRCRLPCRFGPSWSSGSSRRGGCSSTGVLPRSASSWAPLLLGIRPTRS